MAEQLAEVIPLQLQVHGPEPLAVVGVPEAQRLFAGLANNACQLRLPQTPFMTGASAYTELLFTKAVAIFPLLLAVFVKYTTNPLALTTSKAPVPAS